MKNQESKESMIMKLKKFIAILSVATMTAGLAVGCGSSSDSGSSDSSSAATGILQMISPSFQEKMVQEQEEHSLNFSGLKKRKTAKKLI